MKITTVLISHIKLLQKLVIITIARNYIAQNNNSAIIQLSCSKPHYCNTAVKANGKSSTSWSFEVGEYYECNRQRRDGYWRLRVNMDRI